MVRKKIGKQRMSLGQITRFRFEMKIGDRVITYYPEFRVYLVGEISSDYQYQKNSPGDHNHIREVNWLGRVKRDSLSVATRNTIGAIMTLFLLSDSAATEINDLLEGKKTPFLTIDNDDSESEIENLKKEYPLKNKQSVRAKDWLIVACYCASWYLNDLSKAQGNKRTVKYEFACQYP